MNSLSVSSKSWILKKYNQDDVIFFKDNYSLDEIISKLLSIISAMTASIEIFTKSDTLLGKSSPIYSLIN